MTSAKGPSSTSSARALADDGVGCSRRTGGAPTRLARPLPSGSFLLVSEERRTHSTTLRASECWRPTPCLQSSPLAGRWRTRSDPPDDFRSTTRPVAKRSRSRIGHTYAARHPFGLLQRALLNRRLGPRPRRRKRNPRRATKTNSTPAFASRRLFTSPRVAMLCSSDAARPATSSFRTRKCCETSRLHLLELPRDVRPSTSMFFEVLNPTYHSPITIESSI